MWICRQIALVIILSLVLVCPGHGEESDIFDFFEEEAKAVQVVTVSGGVCTEIRQYFDMLAMLGAMGALGSSTRAASA